MTSPRAYYNEHEPYAAQWLRNLIAAGHLPPGEVDERDIRDVTPAELLRFTQCHFFAGIGVWPHALRRAGWPDDRPIWTGSCPCQPFSAAGDRGGFDDERHLWPHWFWLIDQCRPPVVTGEQVASKDGLGWLDLVSADLEGAGYAFAASDLCAAGFGMDWGRSQSGQWLRRAIHDCADPFIARALGNFAEWAGANLAGEGADHIRQRLYFVGLGDSECEGLEGRGRSLGGEYEALGQAQSLGSVGGVGNGSSGGCGVLGDAAREGRGRHAHRASDPSGRMDDPTSTRRDWAVEGPEGDSRDKARVRRPSAGRDSGRLADFSGRGRKVANLDAGGGGSAEGLGEADGLGMHRPSGGPSEGDSRGRGSDWLLCRDAKWRSVEARTFPLAHAPPARVGRLRSYGNALDAQTATEFVAAVMDLADQFESVSCK